MTVALVNMLGWLTPGPNTLVIAGASLGRGLRAGAVTGLGVAAGGLVWASLAVLGVGAVFETLPTLFVALRAAGGTYLVWMGWRTWCRAAQSRVPEPATRARHGDFLTGMAVNLTNPKAVLFHGAVLAAIVPADAPTWFLVVVVAFAQMQAAVQHTLTALLFSTRAAGAVFGALGFWTDRLFGGVFAALGLGLVWQATHRN